MLGWQVALLPAGSLALQLPGDVPTGKSAGVQLAVQLQLSVQLATGVTVVPPTPAHSTFWPGQVTVGFSLSATRTYEVQLAVEPPVPVPTTDTRWSPGPSVSEEAPSNVQATRAAVDEQVPARPPLLTVALHTPGDVDTCTGELGVPTQLTVTGGGVTVTKNVI
jgi:hypothetical protein